MSQRVWVQVVAAEFWRQCRSYSRISSLCARVQTAIARGMNAPTADTRRLAVDVLHHALSTRTAPEFIALSQFGGGALAENDARFVRAQLLTALRHLGQIDAMIAQYLDKPLPPTKAWVQCALRVGAAQLHFGGVPPHAAVHATVEAVKRSKFKALAGMVNAVLKKIAQHSPIPDAATNIPAWLNAKLTTQYGAAMTAQMARVAAVQPAYDMQGIAGTVEDATRLNAHVLRVNGYEMLMQMLAQHPQSFVQDIAASYPVAMLGDVRGKRVLEIGAAPGGKTMQLLMAGANVTALDRSATRMQRLQENLDTRGLTAECVVADAFTYTPSQAPDIVVLDAPCSATGTWRKHPEVLHLVDEKTITDLADIQARLLAHTWGWLTPGGRLLYIVCSLHEEEGEAQLAAFLTAHADARISAPETADIHAPALRADGSLRTHLAMMDDVGGMDGFFAVILEKV